MSYRIEEAYVRFYGRKGGIISSAKGSVDMSATGIKGYSLGFAYGL